MIKFKLFFTLLLVSGSLLFGATEFWFTRGINQATGTAQTNNRNYGNLNNWSKSLPANPYYNTVLADSLPTASGKVRLATNSGANGSANIDNNNKYINLDGDYSVGQFEVSAYGGIPTEFRGSDRTLTFNTVKVDNRSQVDIIAKYANSIDFTFYINLAIADRTSGSATVTILNSSDSALIFSGKTISMLGKESSTATLQFAAKARTQSGTNSYQAGNINIESQLTGLGTVQFIADDPSETQTVGSIWVMGTETNTATFVASYVRLYLDKSPGAYAISSVSTSTDRQVFTLQNRAYVCLMRDNQIDPVMELRFGTPISNRPDDSSLVAGVLDLNGYSESVRRIYFNKSDAGMVTSGVIGVIDFGNGGEQSFTCQSLSYYQRYLNVGATWVEFRNYKLGEDHFYCKETIFRTATGAEDTNRKNMLRFPEFGVYGVDYQVVETTVTINGESYFEYSPQPL